jgi:hypothetical protein
MDGSNSKQRVYQNQNVLQSCLEEAEGVTQMTSSNTSVTDGDVTTAVGKQDISTTTTVDGSNSKQRVYQDHNVSQSCLEEDKGVTQMTSSWGF